MVNKIKKRSISAYEPPFRRLRQLYNQYVHKETIISLRQSTPPAKDLEKNPYMQEKSLFHAVKKDAKTWKATYLLHIII